MAHFYGEIQGGRGRVTRTGTKKSGMTAHIRGWHIGVAVDCCTDADGKDVITIHQTGGTNRSTPTRLVATIKEA